MSEKFDFNEYVKNAHPDTISISIKDKEAIACVYLATGQIRPELTREETIAELIEKDEGYGEDYPLAGLLAVPDDDSEDEIAIYAVVNLGFFLKPQAWLLLTMQTIRLGAGKFAVDEMTEGTDRMVKEMFLKIYEQVQKDLREQYEIPL
jgi:hypothetical protein